MLTAPSFNDILPLIAGSPELIVLVDLDTGEEIHYRDSGAFGPMDKDYSGLNLFERTARYAQEVVIDDDRERFLCEMEPDALRRAALVGVVTEVDYTAVLGGEACKLKTRYIPFKTGGGQEHVLAVKTVTFS